MATLRVRRLDANHDMTFGGGKNNYAATGEATGQRLRTRLLLILGEWFLDTTAGVPWLQPPDSDTRPIMGGPRDLQYSEGVLKAAILGTDGVATLDSFSMTFDGTTRKLSVSASGTTADGDAFNIQVTGP
jgi:hypothetical protein